MACLCRSMSSFAVTWKKNLSHPRQSLPATTLLRRCLPRLLPFPPLGTVPQPRAPQSGSAVLSQDHAALPTSTRSGQQPGGRRSVHLHICRTKCSVFLSEKRARRYHQDALESMTSGAMRPEHSPLPSSAAAAPPVGFGSLLTQVPFPRAGPAGSGLAPAYRVLPQSSQVPSSRQGLQKCSANK